MVVHQTERGDGEAGNGYGIDGSAEDCYEEEVDALKEIIQYGGTSITQIFVT